MLSGLIVYSQKDKEKNTWFVDKCIDSFAKRGVSLLYKEEKEVNEYLRNHKVDFVINRARNYQLVELLENKGIRCFNNSLTNKVVNNKLLSYQFLSSKNVPVIPSFSSLEEVGSLPTIMKNVNGHGGSEVFLINSKEEAETIKDKNKQYVYQRYYPNSGDLRLYVLNKKVVGAVLRKNNKDFRSNFSLGGEVKAYQPEQEIVDLAIKVATLLNADYIGVDFIKVENTWCVNEIEDPVGARMLYKTSNIDVIELFVDYICSL